MAAVVASSSLPQLPPGLPPPQHHGSHVPFGMSALAWSWTLRTLVTVILFMIGITCELAQFLEIARPTRKGPFVPFFATLVCLLFVMPVLAYMVIKVFALAGPSA